MTILEVVKSNFLVNSVPGGLQVSFSYGLTTIMLSGLMIYGFVKRKFRKNK